jgi:hypothetical protein
LTSTIVSENHSLLGGGGEAVAQARRRNPRGGEELLIVEGDHLRPALGLEIALEISREVERRNGLAGTDRAGCRCEVAGALDNAEPGGRCDLLHECAGGLRTVGIDHDHAEAADHRVAEHRGQHHEGEERHAEDQDQRGAVVQQPSRFAPRNQPEPGLRPAFHCRVRQSR